MSLRAIRYIKDALGISHVEAAVGQITESPDELGYTFVRDEDLPASSLDLCNAILPQRDRYAITGAARLAAGPVALEQIERVRAEAGYDKTAMRAYDVARGR